MITSGLERYESSSFHQLWFKKKRWSFSNFECCLDAAGGLKDAPKGKRLYRDYLKWLAMETGEQKRLGFETMCKGWAKGTKDFKKAVLEDSVDKGLKQVVESEAKEMRKPYWDCMLTRSLTALKKTRSGLKSDRKGAPWKVALACYLRESYLIPNTWLSESLNMGTPNSLSSQVSRYRKECRSEDGNWDKLKNQENVD